MFTDRDLSLPTPRPRHLEESSQQDSVSLPSNIATRQRGRQTDSKSIFRVKSELCEAMKMAGCKFCPRDHFISWFGSALTCTKSDTWNPRLNVPSEGRGARYFCRPSKIHRTLPGSNLRTSGPEAGALPRDHDPQAYTLPLFHRGTHEDCTIFARMLL